MAEAALKMETKDNTATGAQAVVRGVLDRVKADGRNALTAPEGKIVCDAYGIPVPQEGVATSAEEAKGLAERMGFPVVMKIVSPDILHKTEAGGVLVGLKSADEVARGYDTILKNAKAYKADAKIDGVQVQQMLKGGTEVIVGSITDGSFGKLVAFGLGGVLVEVLKDITFRLAPATKDDALSMLDGIQAAEMLKGVRGGEAVNRDALAALIVGCVAQAARDHDEGRPHEDLPGRLLEENFWRAIRHGMDGRLIDYATGTEQPAPAAVENLLSWTAPMRSELGLDPVLPALNGAQRQRRAIDAGTPMEEVYAASVQETRQSYAQEVPTT
jgi:hypothetical protein